MSRLSKNKIKESSDFKFKESENTACFSCRHVTMEGQSILFVTHDSDGYWQFLCGQEHEEEDAKTVSMKSITLIDPSVNALHAMPKGVGAERESVNAEWIAFKLEED